MRIAAFCQSRHSWHSWRRASALRVLHPGEHRPGPILRPPLAWRFGDFPASGWYLSPNSESQYATFVTALIGTGTPPMEEGYSITIGGVPILPVYTSYVSTTQINLAWLT